MAYMRSGAWCKKANIIPGGMMRLAFWSFIYYWKADGNVVYGNVGISYSLLADI
jgi:hypothetical protein